MKADDTQNPMDKIILAWLFDKLEITNPDFWEGDALLSLKKPIYVAMRANNMRYEVPTVREAIEWAIGDEIANPQFYEEETMKTYDEMDFDELKKEADTIVAKMLFAGSEIDKLPPEAISYVISRLNTVLTGRYAHEIEEANS